MPRIAYKTFRFREDALNMIAQANAVIAEYQASGFNLTLRQLYYQFVARAWIANKDTEYKRLGGVINDARLAGMIDWYALQDRTRFLRARGHHGDPDSLIRGLDRAINLNMWDNQAYRIEVWVEKDALIDVVAQACNPLDVPHFSCRGYTSQTEMWNAGQRIKDYIDDGFEPIIIHLGDHDPSGIDMSRDIQDRLELFTGASLNFDRIALNMDQVQQYDPPPNPAKITDSRALSYISIYGNESWELDALDPQVLADLITATVQRYRDFSLWDEALRDQAERRLILQKLENRWDEVKDLLNA